MLKYINKKAGITEENKWDLIVDFCAYVRKHVKQILKAFTRKTRLYVLISTDSVYEVCDVDVRDGAIREIDDLRPGCDELIEQANKNDLYGHNKLRCEEYLKSHSTEAERGFNYICLRLPDVIGPYDYSGRYWAYLVWFTVMDYWPVHRQDSSDTRELSFVASEDVAQLITSFTDKVEEEEWVKMVHTQSYNLGFNETPTLTQFLEILVSL